jgi:hypothetical protein
MVQASGKSTFVKTHLIPKGYVHVNRDTLKTADKCLKVCRESLKDGKSVVVDNTSPEPATRAQYIKLAEGPPLPAASLLLGRVFGADVGCNAWCSGRHSCALLLVHNRPQHRHTPQSVPREDFRRVCD